MCVKHGLYTVSMENRCQMAIKHRVFNMNRSSLHAGKSLNESVTSLSYFLFLKNGDLKVVIQLSGRFVYPDDFAGDQSVRINEARLYSFIFISDNPISKSFIFT
jgi:hypothetical protein